MKLYLSRLNTPGCAGLKAGFINKWFLSAGLAVALAIISIGVGASSRHEPDAVPNGGPPVETTVTHPSHLGAPQRTDQDLKVKLVTLTPEGFEPDLLQASKGRFLLAIHDLSRLDEVSIILNRVRGNKLHEVRLSRARKNESKTIDLTPGEYLLTEANHPRWVCKITVNPH